MSSEKRPMTGLNLSSDQERQASAYDGSISHSTGAPPMSSEKARHVGMIAHIDHGKTSLTAAVTRILQPPMSSDVKIPGWAEKVAFEAQTAAIEECKAQRLGANYDYPFVTCRSKEVLDRHIARALLDAEQRGRKAGLEAAAEVVRTFAIKAARAHLDAWNSKAIVRMFNEIADFLPAAIRSLGEQE